jgi:hypothetical protein
MPQLGDYKTDTQQFLTRVSAKHQPKMLREWALKLLDEHKDDKGWVMVPEADLPGFVVDLDPGYDPHVIVIPKVRVMIDWGSGFGHWGLCIGDTEGSGLYLIEWASGVKAYHTLQ